MITETHPNGTKMELDVVPVWTGPDILIKQLFSHGDIKGDVEWIELSVEHAELLIQELQAAIDECRRMDQQYDEDMKWHEQQLQEHPDNCPLCEKEHDKAMRSGNALQSDLTESASEIRD